MATDIRPHLIVVQNTTLTPPIKRETRLYKECHKYAYINTYFVLSVVGSAIASYEQTQILLRSYTKLAPLIDLDMYECTDTFKGFLSSDIILCKYLVGVNNIYSTIH